MYRLMAEVELDRIQYRRHGNNTGIIVTDNQCQHQDDHKESTIAITMKLSAMKLLLFVVITGCSALSRDRSATRGLKGYSLSNNENVGLSSIVLPVDQSCAGYLVL